MINLAKGWRNPHTNKRGSFDKHNRKNNGGERRKLLDMSRQKYFRFDLEDMLDEFSIADNKNTISATIVNKMTTQSFDDTLDYVGRLVENETLNKEKADKLRNLLQRYSKWR
ncbi:MAG: hypothetical protein ABIH11_05940 [Candidatus Altiarchaeota archaeon]